MKPWSSLPPNMRTTASGPLLLHHLGHVLEPVEDVRPLETAGDTAVDVADRLDRPPLAHRSQDRLARDDDEGVAGDPDPERAGGGELLASRRRRSRVGHGLRHRDTRVDLVVLRAPENRLEPSSRLVEEERSADRRERLGNGESDVSLPALGLDLRRLPQPLGVQERADEEGEKRDGDGGACRVQPPALLVDASAGMSSSSSASELEVDERGHALRSHGMGGEEHDGEDDCLRRHREA